MFDAHFSLKSAAIRTKKIQRAREVELRQINRVFNSLLECIEKRRNFLMNTLRNSFSKLETDSIERISAAQEQFNRCKKLIDSSQEFIKTHDKGLYNSFHGSFIQDEERENIVSLNKSGNELFSTVESELTAVKKELSGKKTDSESKLPQCSFDYEGLSQFIKKIGTPTGIDLPEIYGIEPEYKITGGSEKESRVLFLKNIEGNNTACPYNYSKGIWEKSIQLPNHLLLPDLTEATMLQFGDIGLTGGSKKGNIAGERTFLVLRSTMKLENMPGMINRRYFHAAVELCGELFVLGGLNGKGRMNSCEKINYLGAAMSGSEAATDQIYRWQPIAGLNITRSKLTACAFDYKTIYVFGGEQFPSIEKYSVALNEWELFPPVSEMDPSYILSTIGIYPSGTELLILGKFFAYLYNPSTKQAQRKGEESEFGLERATLHKNEVIAFTKSQPQLCIIMKTSPFKIVNKASCLHPQYGVDITSNPCAVSCFE